MNARPDISTRESAQDAQEAIADEFSFFSDWTERYQYLIDLGRKLPAFPPALQTEANKVQGCQSQVWLVAEGDRERMNFRAISDSAIVSGLIALLLRVYSGRSSEEITATDPVFLKDLGLLEALSTNRGNGIAAMARKVREVAALEGARAPVG